MDSPAVSANIMDEENFQIKTGTISTEIEIPEVPREINSNSAKQPLKKKKPSSQKNANIVGGNSTQMKADSASTETKTAKITKRKTGSDNAKQLSKKRKTSSQKNASIVKGNSPQKKKDAVSTETKATKRKAGSDNAKEAPKTDKSATLAYADMVVEAINSLKMRKGATKEAIMQYLEENHGLDKKSEGRYVTRFLNSGCEKGVLEEVSEERFKVKKVEKAKTGDVKVTKSRAKRGVKTPN